VRGQYGVGECKGENIKGYRQESGVDPHSNTETYIALRTHLENWRWAGVPFLLRSGKRLAAQVSEIAVRFKRPPMLLFSEMAEREGLAPPEPRSNYLVLRIQPDEGISLSFSSKRPGMRVQLDEVTMDFRYDRAFSQRSPEAYERLLLDALRGDAALFTRSDEVEYAWRFITSVINGWAALPPPTFPNYYPFSDGPEEANHLMVGTAHWRSIAAAARSGGVRAPCCRASSPVRRRHESTSRSTRPRARTPDADPRGDRRATPRQIWRGRRALPRGGRERIGAAVFGVAGPVLNGVANIANLRWRVDALARPRHRLPDRTPAERSGDHGVRALHLDARDLLVLSAGEPAPGNRAVIAAGTGLGEALLFWDGALSPIGQRGRASTSARAMRARKRCCASCGRGSGGHLGTGALGPGSQPLHVHGRGRGSRRRARRGRAPRARGPERGHRESSPPRVRRASRRWISSSRCTGHRRGTSGSPLAVGGV
jgi:hypothetical protein